MVINKTSVLPRMCIRMIGEILKTDKKITDQQILKMVKYMESLGIAF